MGKSRYLSGAKIAPGPIVRDMTAADLIETAFLAYNGGRLRDGCRLFTERMLEDDVTVGITLTGALTPAGLGMSALVPLIEAGFVDWIISTGANLYHDSHFGLGLELRQGSPHVSDVELRADEVVRIYDIFFDYSVLLDTDAFFRKLITGDEFQRSMSSAEFHWLCGRYIAQRQQALGQTGTSLLATCYEYDVPVYTSSPGDSSIGMNVAAGSLQGLKLQFDVNADVNETAALVLDCKRRGGRSAVAIFGGGSPKNFMLQTEPQIQEVMGIAEKGHDYFLQFTDARPDTGGLSGATPAEAVSWGKVDPDMLPDAVVCYSDATIALPLLTAYALTRHAPREPKRLYRRRAEALQRIRDEYERSSRNEAVQERARHDTHDVTLERSR
jgi:deoxyhypusine synthase